MSSVSLCVRSAARVGTGIGMIIRAGGVIDGLEVVAVFTKRRTGFSNSEIIMLFNAFIFAGATFHFGLETSMYSLITYFAATRATDYVVDGIEQYTALNIISSQYLHIFSIRCIAHAINLVAQDILKFE